MHRLPVSAWRPSRSNSHRMSSGSPSIHHQLAAEEEREAEVAEEEESCPATFSPNPSVASANARRADEDLDTPSRYADEEERKQKTPMTCLNEVDELYYKSVVATTADNGVDIDRVRRVLADQESGLSDNSWPASMTNESCSDSDEATPGASSEHRRLHGSRKGPAHATRWAVRGAEEAGLTEEMLTPDIANRISNNTVELLGQMDSHAYDKEEDDDHSSDDAELEPGSAQQKSLWLQHRRERRERKAKRANREKAKERNLDISKDVEARMGYGKPYNDIQHPLDDANIISSKHSLPGVNQFPGGSGTNKFFMCAHTYRECVSTKKAWQKVSEGSGRRDEGAATKNKGKQANAFRQEMLAKPHLCQFGVGVQTLSRRQFAMGQITKTPIVQAMESSFTRMLTR